jgi:hypothetical protein
MILKSIEGIKPILHSFSAATHACFTAYFRAYDEDGNL